MFGHALVVIVSMWVGMCLGVLTTQWPTKQRFDSYSSQKPNPAPPRCVPDARMVEQELAIAKPRIEAIIGRRLFPEEHADLKDIVTEHLSKKGCPAVEPKRPPV